jgi:hypothetical protein
MSSDKMLAVARSQLGYKEGARNSTKYGEWFGLNYNPWCDMFLAWCADKADEIKAVGKFAWTPSHMQKFKDDGTFGKTPEKGAIVFYKFGKTAYPCNHIGIVESVNKDGTFITIEGNVGNSVKRLRRSMKDVVGFGYPKYAVKSWKNPHPYPGTLLKSGSSGNSVGKVQKRLKELHYNPGPIDNRYGPLTSDAVRDFQKKRKIDRDGIVGPVTWKELFHVKA